jgi:anti-anti-sigma regulatory factor
MADLPSLVVTVDWAASSATVAVHGELDSSTCARLMERLSWVMESSPRRLILDLAGVADRFSAQALAVIVAARRQLPPGSLLDVRSASATVRRDLYLAGWSRVRVSDAAEDVVPVQAGHGGMCR